MVPQDSSWRGRRTPPQEQRAQEKEGEGGVDFASVSTESQRPDPSSAQGGRVSGVWPLLRVTHPCPGKPGSQGAHSPFPALPPPRVLAPPSSGRRVRPAAAEAEAEELLLLGCEGEGVAVVGLVADRTCARGRAWHCGWGGGWEGVATGEGECARG